MLYIMVGLPGSGKSTFAKNNIRGKKIRVVSSDGWREKLFGDASIQADPRRVFDAVNNEVARLLDRGYDVVYDATNLTQRTRKGIIDLFPQVEKTAVYMDVPVEVCIERQQLRKRKVPEEVIRRMADKITAPKTSEGFKKVLTISEGE